MYRLIFLSMFLLHPLYATYEESVSHQLSEIDSDQDALLHAVQVESRKKNAQDKERILREELYLQHQEELADIETKEKRLTLELSQLKDEKKSLKVALAYAKKIRIKKAIKAKRIRAERERVRKLNRITAHIDISSQKMKVYRGKKLLHQWLVSTARKGYSTPTGRYTPQGMEKMHYSRLYHNSPMPYTIFFRGNYAIHGTSSIKRLGKKASHGCVRLHPKNAKTLYSMIRKSGKKNAEIKITY